MQTYYKHIEENYKKLNELEKSVLDYLKVVINDEDKITVAKVAQHFFISPNTITRLSKKLGFDGFVQLRESIRNADDDYYFQEDNDVDEQIRQSKKLINEDRISQVLRIIQESSEVYFFAHGLSKYPCDILADKLRVINKNAVVFNERHVMRHAAIHADKRSLIFTVSLSGETKNLLECTSIAKEQGAAIVSVTGLSKNTLASLADISLFVDYKRIEFEGMDISSRMTIIYLFELLFEQYMDFKVNV